MMFPNNNKPIIKKLSKRSLKVNRTRNLFIILAIILTTMLLTAGFTAGISIVRTAKNYADMGKGVDSHGSFDVTLEQYEEIKKIPKVEQAGLLRDCSETYIQSQEVVGNKVYLKYANQEMFNMNFAEPVEGDYPISSEEIFVPTHILDLFDLPYEVGQKVTLKVSVIEDGREVIKPFQFVLSGYYDPVVPPSSNYAEIFTGEDFINKYNPSIGKDKNKAYVKLNTLTWKSTEDEGWEEMNKIAQSLGIMSIGLDPDFINPSGYRYNISDILAIAVPLVLAVLLIMFSGYLLIYNIFYISVVHDIHFYGLLKTIGTTPSQIKKIIHKQAAILSLIGIPVGLFFGYIVGAVFTPQVMSNTVMAKYVKLSAHPVIFLLSALFSYMTVYISCRKPGKVAGKISPVEAVRYSGAEQYQGRKKIKNSRKGGKLHYMALTNIFRNKGKAITVITSISLSAVIFVFVFNGAMGVDPIKETEKRMQSDFELMHYNVEWYQQEEYKPISLTTYNQLKELPFVTKINKYYMARSNNDRNKIEGGYELVSAFRGEIKNQGLLKQELESYRDAGFPDWTGTFIAPSGNIKIDITGIDAQVIEEEIAYDKIIDGSVDEEKFASGEYIIFCRNKNRDGNGKVYGDGVIKAGDKTELSFYIPQIDKYVTREFTVMAVIKNSDYNRGNADTITIPDTVFEEIYPNHNELISRILLDVDIDLETANHKIKSIINRSGNFQIYFTSKPEVIKEFKIMKSAVMIIGLTISFILGLIGILNMVNTMLTSIFSRRTELAMLESMGMSKKQQKKMLMFEGVFYTIISTIIIIPLGLLSSISTSAIPFFGGFRMVMFWLSMIIVIGVILSISITVPLIAFNLINKSTIIERLRKIE